MFLSRLSMFTVMALGLGISATGSAQTADPAQIIRERREGLRAVGAHMEAMQAIAASRGDTRPAVARIEAIQAFFVNFPDRFPPSTQAGDTRALPAVFSDRAGFVTAHGGLTAPLANLSTVAASGDSAGFGPALQQTGAACGACHRAYRAR